MCLRRFPQEGGNRTRYTCNSRYQNEVFELPAKASARPSQFFLSATVNCVQYFIKCSCWRLCFHFWFSPKINTSWRCSITQTSALCRSHLTNGPGTLCRPFQCGGFRRPQSKYFPFLWTRWQTPKLPLLTQACRSVRRIRPTQLLYRNLLYRDRGYDQRRPGTLRFLQ